MKKTLFIITEPKGNRNGKFNYSLCNKRGGKWNKIQSSDGQGFENKKDCLRTAKNNNPHNEIVFLFRKEFKALFK